MSREMNDGDLDVRRHGDVQNLNSWIPQQVAEVVVYRLDLMPGRGLLGFLGSARRNRDGAKSGLPIVSGSDLADAAQKIVAAVRNHK